MPELCPQWEKSDPQHKRESLSTAHNDSRLVRGDTRLTVPKVAAPTGAVKAVAPNVVAREVEMRFAKPGSFPPGTLACNHLLTGPAKQKIPATAPTESWKPTLAATNGFIVIRTRAPKDRANGGS